MPIVNVIAKSVNQARQAKILRLVRRNPATSLGSRTISHHYLNYHQQDMIEHRRNIYGNLRDSRILLTYNAILILLLARYFVDTRYYLSTTIFITILYFHLKRS